MKHVRALLINPPIHDVSAYSFWSMPLGLLSVGGLLRRHNVGVRLIDCCEVDETRRKGDGRAPFLKERIEPPRQAGGLRRRFRRYGIGGERLRRRLAAEEEPDLVLITSIMTYWYPGTVEAVTLAREAFPEALIVVGGIYPSLCREHAGRTLTEADLIVGNGEFHLFRALMKERFGRELGPADDMAATYPCLDLYQQLHYAPILTGTGCAFRCTYCATPFLHPVMRRRAPQAVIDEIVHWHGAGAERFVLYDDNFLYEQERHAAVILEAVSRLPFRVAFYNPNGLNVASIDGKAARLLREAGFAEVRLGFETAEPGLQAATGGKATRAGLERAVGHLRRAGFSGTETGVYVLAGLPLQRASDVASTIDYLGPLGVRIHLAQYTPIPHTHLFGRYKTRARYPVEEEPLFQNNALFPYEWEEFTGDDLNALKQRVRSLNGNLDPPRPAAV